MNFQRQRNRAIADRDAINRKYKAALAEIERLREDAERYQWLLNNMVCRMPGGFGYTLSLSWGADTTCNAVIDAAREG